MTLFDPKLMDLIDDLKWDPSDVLLAGPAHGAEVPIRPHENNGQVEANGQVKCMCRTPDYWCGHWVTQEDGLCDMCRYGCKVVEP